MSAANIIFYMLGGMIIGSALLSVTTRNIFRAAVFLLFSLVGIAGLYFWMEYEFIAAVQIVVYVGGIVVLIIFSIFLTAQIGNQLPKPLNSRLIFAGLAALFGLAFTVNLIQQNDFISSGREPVSPTVSNIGTQMLDMQNHGYLLPFEVVSMLLLAAMIGCIVIAIRSKPELTTNN